jgi:hypothetical protein
MSSARMGLSNTSSTRFGQRAAWPVPLQSEELKCRIPTEDAYGFGANVEGASIVVCTVLSEPRPSPAAVASVPVCSSRTWRSQRREGDSSVGSSTLVANSSRSSVLANSSSLRAPC